MKKFKLLLAIAISVLLYSCSGNSNYPPRIITDLERDGLKGDVCTYDDGQIIKEYNEKGWIIRRYEYHNKAKRIKSETTYASDGCTQVSRKYFSYDYNGKPSEDIYNDTITVEERMAQHFRDTSYKYTFNKDGNLIKSYQVKYPRDGKREYTTVYTYDDNNNVIESIYTFYGNKATRTSLEYALRSYKHLKYEYNENGDVVKRTSFDEEGKVDDVLEYSYEYDKQGNWIKFTNPYGSVTERKLMTFEQHKEQKKFAAELAAKKAEAAKNEDFKTFLKKFAGNKSFQFERIPKFPLGITTTYDCDPDVEPIVEKITKARWQKYNYFDSNKLSALYNAELGKITKNSETSYTCNVGAMSWSLEAKFIRKDGKWYMTNYDAGYF